MTQSFQINAQITGYGGQSVNLLGAIDHATGLVLVAKEMPLGSYGKGAMVVSNDTRLQVRDTLFSEVDLSAAIGTYYSLKSSGLIELHGAITKHDPAHHIENGGMDENGAKYRLSPDITNGNVAILAIALTAGKVALAEDCVQMADDLAAMFLSI